MRGPKGGGWPEGLFCLRDDGYTFCRNFDKYLLNEFDISTGYEDPDPPHPLLDLRMWLTGIVWRLTFLAIFYSNNYLFIFGYVW